MGCVKKYLLVLLFCMMAIVSNAKIYYISSTSGDDGYTDFQAQNSSTPWKTLEKVNSFFKKINPGDSILFKRGETFNGSLLVTKSGSASLPIVIGSYGTGSKPVISGFITLSNWVSKDGSIFQSDCPTCIITGNMVTVNGVQQAIGRYPNSGYLKIESHSGVRSIYDKSLAGMPNWKGAELVIRKNRWVIDRNEIQNHSGSTLTYRSGSEYAPLDGFGYFIQKSPQTLDQLGEWYFEPSDKKMQMYFGGNNPNSYLVKSSVIDVLVSVKNNNYIKFENLSLEGANVSAFHLDNGKNIQIQSCDIDFSGINAITGTSMSTYLSIENTTINHTNNNAIRLDGQCTNVVIKGNTIKNTGLIAGMGQSGDGWGESITSLGYGTYSAIITNGSNMLIEGNKIDSAGYIGIRFHGSSVLIKNNLVSNFCLTKDDGAGIYHYKGKTPDVFVDRKILNNIVLNGIGTGEGTDYPDSRFAEGIYLDDNTSNVEISGNTVANCIKGIYLHYAHEIQLSSNTLYNNKVQLHMLEDNENDLIRNIKFTDNISFSKGRSQLAAHLLSEKNDIGSFGMFDKNAYASPFQQNVMFVTEVNNEKPSFKPLDFQNWKSVYNQEQNSTKSLIKVPSLLLKGLVSANKYRYGTFQGRTDIPWISTYSIDGKSVSSYDGSGKIDGTGSLKVSYTSQTFAKADLIIGDIGKLSSTKNYILRFSTLGLTKERSIGVSLRKSNTPYTSLTPIQYITIPAIRSNHEVLLSFPKSETNANIVFQLSGTDGTLWLDNIELYEADVDIVNPDDHIRFEYNANNAVKTVSLDKIYVDAKNNRYQKKITLAPFTSLVLIAVGDTVAKSSQMIKFPVIPDQVYGGAPFNVRATSSSALPIIYKVLSGPGILKDSMITLIGAGTLILEASQPGDDTYNPAPTLTQSISVSKGDQSLVFELPATKNFGDAPFVLTASASSGLAISYSVVSGAAVISGNKVSLTGAGAVSIEALQWGNANYKASASIKIVTANKANQTINFSRIANKTIGDAPFSLAATASSALPVIYRIKSGPALVSGNMVTLTGTGTVTIEATQMGSDNYDPAPTTTQNFSVIAVEKIDQSISFATLTDQTYGDDPFVLIASASSGLTISYKVISGPAEISGNKVSLTGAGTVSIEASQSGDPQHNVASSIKVFTVNKANQMINFSRIANKTIGDAPFCITATASSALPVSYRIISGPARISESLISLTGTGTVAIEAMQMGSDNYNPAPTTTQNIFVVAVEKINQSISFQTIADRTFGDAPIVLTASASSGLTISYKLISGPAEISGSKVSLTGAGVVSIEASQSGDTQHNVASLIQVFTVNKANQTINFSRVANKTIGDVPFSLAATASSALPVSYRVKSGPALVSGNLVTLTGTGTVAIDATQMGSDNYNPAPTTTQNVSVVTVEKINQSISFQSIADRTFGDAPIVLSASASSGLTISYRIVSGLAEMSGNKISLTGAGVVSIEASQPGDDKYNRASSIKTFTVNKVNQTISFSRIANKTIGNAPFSITATASSALPVNYRIKSGPALVSRNMITLTGTGTVTIEATQAGNENYYLASIATQIFSVVAPEKIDQSISFQTIADRTYGDAPFILTASASSSLAIGYKVLSGSAKLSGNKVSLTGAGVVSIEASQSGDTQHNVASSIKVFTVNKANQMINFSSIANKTIGDAPFSMIAVASSALPVSYRIKSGPAMVSGNVITLTGTGTVTIEATQIGSDNYNPAPTATQDISVNKIDQSISFPNLADRTYGDAPIVLTASASSGLAINYKVLSGPAELSGNKISLTGTGIVRIETAQSGDAQHNSASLIKVFMVNKATQTIDFNHIANKTIGDAPFSMIAVASSALPVSYRIKSGPALVSGNVVTLTGTGTVAIEATQMGSDNFNVAPTATQNFSVVAPEKINQSISFQTIADRTYGDAPFILTASASSGLTISYKVMSGPAMMSGNKVSLTGAGVVSIEASQSGDAKYNAASAINVFTVKKSNQTIDFNRITNKTIGDTPFTLAATASSALPVSYRIKSGPGRISESLISLTGTGIVAVEATQMGSNNYNPASIATQNFSVVAPEKINQSISFATLADRTYGDAPIILSASATSGLAISYKVLSGPAEISGNKISLTGAGTVSIEASQSGDAKYKASSSIKILTVNKTNQTINFSRIANKKNGDAPFPMLAVASSALPVSYRVVSGSARISENLVSITGAGNVIIEATQAGNYNYHSAPPVIQDIFVVEADKIDQSISFASINDKVYGDVPFTLVASSSSGKPISYKILSGPAEVSGNTVKVKGAGTVIIACSQSGDGTYNPASTVNQGFVVHKANPNLKFEELSDKLINDLPFDLIAASNGQTPISFTSSNPAAVTVSNESGRWLATITGSGLATITAFQLEEDHYKSASVSHPLAVNGQLDVVTEIIEFSTFPNPFTSHLNIQFILNESGSARLSVYNLQGKMVSELFAGHVFAGTPMDFRLEKDGLTTGAYIVRLVTVNKTLFKKVIFNDL